MHLWSETRRNSSSFPIHVNVVVAVRTCSSMHLCSFSTSEPCPASTEPRRYLACLRLVFVDLLFRLHAPRSHPLERAEVERADAQLSAVRALAIRIKCNLYGWSAELCVEILDDSLRCPRRAIKFESDAIITVLRIAIRILSNKRDLVVPTTTWITSPPSFFVPVDVVS